MQDVIVELRELNCKFEGKEDRPFYGIFKAIMNNDTIVSKKTSSMYGDFDAKKNRTLFNWSITQDLYENPQITMSVTLEQIKQGSLQLCVFQDREHLRSQ